jgi:hypothetical protein
VFEYNSLFQQNQNLEEKEYDSADGATQFQLMRGDVKYKNQIAYAKQQALAGSVYRWVIERDDFINETANGFPYFYSEIIKHFNYKYPSNEEVVGWFFTSLVAANNRFLKREINSNVNLEEGQRYNYRFEEGNHILKALLFDLRVAEHTYVWKPFGETAIQEIRSLESGHFLFTSYDSTLYPDSKFLDLAIGKSIRFFDLMVCQAIYKKHGYHMWLPYYYHFAHALIKKTSGLKFDTNDWSGDYPLNFLFLLYRMVSNMYDWFHAMEDALYARHRTTISKTMSGVLLEIASSDSIGEKWKVNQFGLMIRIYCEISTAPLKEGHAEESKVINESIVKSIEDVFIKPGYGSAEQIQKYHDVLKAAWDKFDRVPYEETTALDNLQSNVFDKL